MYNQLLQEKEREKERKRNDDLRGGRERHGKYTKEREIRAKQNIIDTKEKQGELNHASKSYHEQLNNLATLAYRSARSLQRAWLVYSFRIRLSLTARLRSFVKTHTPCTLSVIDHIVRSLFEEGFRLVSIRSIERESQRLKEKATQRERARGERESEGENKAESGERKERERGNERGRGKERMKREENHSFLLLPLLLILQDYSHCQPLSLSLSQGKKETVKRKKPKGIKGVRLLLRYPALLMEAIHRAHKLYLRDKAFYFATSIRMVERVEEKKRERERNRERERTGTIGYIRFLAFSLHHTKKAKEVLFHYEKRCEESEEREREEREREREREREQREREEMRRRKKIAERMMMEDEGKVNGKEEREPEQERERERERERGVEGEVCGDVETTREGRETVSHEEYLASVEEIRLLKAEILLFNGEYVSSFLCS